MSMGAVKYGTYQTGNSIAKDAKVYSITFLTAAVIPQVVRAIRPAGTATLRSVALNTSVGRLIFERRELAQHEHGVPPVPGHDHVPGTHAVRWQTDEVSLLDQSLTRAYEFDLRLLS
jgi:hypothetical protein